MTNLRWFQLTIFSSLCAACGTSSPHNGASSGGSGNSAAGSTSGAGHDGGAANTAAGSDAGGGANMGTLQAGAGGALINVAGAAGSMMSMIGAGGTLFGGAGGSTTGMMGGSGTGGSIAGSSGAGGVSGSVCGGTSVAVPAAERISNGNPLLPPKWAFGVLWGSYYDQTGSTFAQGNKLLDAAARVRAEYSGDLMWIDSSWLWHDFSTGGAHYICFQFDDTVFPDPASMIQALQQEHFHFGVWEWPWMGHGCQYFQTAVDNKYFIMNGAQPATTTSSGAWHGDTAPATFDYTNAAALTWWVGLNKPLTDWGLDFLKLDTDAPQQNSATAAGGGVLADPSKSFAHEYHHAAYQATQAYPAAHNAAAALNGARGFIMPKTPSPGNDQHPGWWTDDTPATWAGFQTDMSRASMLDTSSTAAYWCGDTGGYSGVPTDELYIRWLEYSSFTPLQEFFGAKTPGLGARFPWLFGAQAQTIQKQYTDLRYRLLPFRYSNALIAYQVKPVKYPVTWVGSQQILVGSGSSQLLVQPVTAPGAAMATVALPAGTWIHYFTGKSYTGSASVATPLEQEPVFVKAGSIIPMGPPLHWVDEVPADPLTLDIYPAGSTSYTLYEDDGISEGYLGGAYSTTKFSADDTSGKPVLTIGPQVTAKYAFAGQLCTRSYILKVNGRAAAPLTVTRDGTAVPQVTQTAFASATEGWYYDLAAQIVFVKFRLASSVGTSVSL